jgi:hypothetical protein
VNACAPLRQRCGGTSDDELAERLIELRERADCTRPKGPAMNRKESDLSDLSQPASGMLRCHGGFRNLRSFQVAEIIYDATVAFCDRFINPRSRTPDQMVQAARSGRQKHRRREPRVRYVQPDGNPANRWRCAPPAVAGVSAPNSGAARTIPIAAEHDQENDPEARTIHRRGSQVTLPREPHNEQLAGRKTKSLHQSGFFSRS